MHVVTVRYCRCSTICLVLYIAGHAYENKSPWGPTRGFRDTGYLEKKLMVYWIFMLDKTRYRMRRSLIFVLTGYWTFRLRINRMWDTQIPLGLASFISNFRYDTKQNNCLGFRAYSCLTDLDLNQSDIIMFS